MIILLKSESRLFFESKQEVAEEPGVIKRVPLFNAHSSKFVCDSNLDSFYTASSKCSSKEVAPMKSVACTSTESVVSIKVSRVKCMLLQLMRSELHK